MVRVPRTVWSCWMVGVALAAGCGRASAPPCPSPAALEEIHAAAFHFEHGAIAAAEEHLARARALAPAGRAADPVTAQILAQLSVASQRIRTDHERAILEVEAVRLTFREWRCLPEELHRQFHVKLPPSR